MSHVLIFCQIKGLLKVHNCGKFHLHSHCRYQLTFFWSFAHHISIYTEHIFEGVSGPYFSKYDPILLKFTLEVVFSQTKRVFKEPFKNLNLLGNETVTKFALLAHLWTLLTPEDDRNRKKYIHSRKNFNHRAIQICQNQDAIFPLFYRKNTINIRTIWTIFCTGWGHTFKGQNQNLT